MNPLVARLSDTFSSRSLMLVSSVILSIGAVMAGAATSVPTFLTGRVVQGIGAGGLASTAQVMVVKLSTLKRRGFLLGALNAGYTAGVSLGGVIGGAALQHSSWVCPAFFPSPI